VREWGNIEFVILVETIVAEGRLMSRKSRIWTPNF